MRLQRLLNMGIGGLADRGRQEGRKWLERQGVARPGRPHYDATEFPLESFRNTSSARFFEGAVSPATPSALAGRMPQAHKRTLLAIQPLWRAHFDLLGYRDLFFGNPVDWHLDPISGRRAPQIHWSRIDPLDSMVAGDSKVVWELNRHQWLVRLGQAFRLTEDERLVETFELQVRAWLRANPAGIGINWASSLEAALRLIAWCWALCLFRDAGGLTTGLFKDLLEAIRAHAAHVERYLSRTFSPNTHLTGEALGLFYAGTLFPELRAAARWRKLGASILLEQSERQILQDGVYFEQSTCYQCYTVEIYLHFMILGRRSGWDLPAAVGERVRRMLDFLLAMRLPDGSLPSIGDADGGRLLPLDDRSPEDVRGLFSTAAALFGRADYAWAAGGVAPETLWLLGPAGVDAFDALAPAPPATAASRLFPAGGYAVMRSGWSPHDHQLIFDVGPLGCPISGGHGHADLLSIQCCAHGKRVLTDAGTYGYTLQPAWRDFFRGTAAHSTVMVDGAGQAEPAGPFGWKTRPASRLRRFFTSDAFDFADAEHDAYSRLPDPVLHRRRVLFVKPRYWVVVDDLVGRKEHRVELRFQFAPMVVTVDPALWARAYAPGRHDLWIRPFGSAPLEAEVREGGESPIEGWVSAGYGRRSAAPVLVYRAVARLPLRIVTLLLPSDRPFASPPAVSPLFRDDVGLAGILFEESGEIVRFEDDRFVVEKV
jgi:heparinase II/III-like protein